MSKDNRNIIILAVPKFIRNLNLIPFENGVFLQASNKMHASKIQLHDNYPIIWQGFSPPFHKKVVLVNFLEPTL